jgi:hypothetical protein
MGLLGDRYSLEITSRASRKRADFIFTKNLLVMDRTPQPTGSEPWLYSPFREYGKPPNQ